MPSDALRAGLTSEATYLVTPDMRPPHVDGILSTSRMIGLVEDTCLDLAQPLLDEGQTSVGTRVEVTHVGTAWTGEAVTIRVRLTKVTQRRLLTFEVEVEAPGGTISTGTHQRLVLERSRLMRPEAPAPRPASTR
jgi:predicted thioesterase